jgi:ATP/maltotriose-dependent transcriptional regulator MalT/DNA-binding SARP family transcriptional activator
MPGPHRLGARDRLHLIDSTREPSVSFAPPDPLVIGPQGRTRATRAPVAVGPGRAVIATPARVRVDAEDGVSGYPIQPGKVQAPALRDETLARARLLDWLDVKIHSRVVFVIGDAGYGKTTLLADFSRRTRLRTLWYRIDEEDRDWVGFLSHLVAAGREHDPSFAPSTAALLRSLEPGGTTREDAIETFLAELPSISSDGAVLIFDDFHLADEVADIRLIAREIVTRAPERLSIVFASRRQPAVPVARLRSLGELAEIGIAELRFSESEMEQLFRETFRRPLEADVLAELARRTEGWAASLSLVQAALRERSPAETRSFVRGLSGAHDELHDYLAEEVVGDLPAIHQQFLMRTSILQLVTPELAQVATGLTAIEVQSLLTESERLGMLGRRTERRSSGQRYHPLVRELLEARLRREVGDGRVADLNVLVAQWAEPWDWRTAAYHFAAAGQWSAVRQVLNDAVETIVATGEFSLAAEYLERLPDAHESATTEVIMSRVAALGGDLAEVLSHARRAAELEPNSDAAISNMISATFLSGDMRDATEFASRLAAGARSEALKEIGEAAKAVIDTSLRGSIDSTITRLEKLVERNRKRGHIHYEGITLLNTAYLVKVQGDGERALALSLAAADALASSSSSFELMSAWLVQAWAKAHLGDLSGARLLLRSASETATIVSRPEYLMEAAEIETWYGAAARARALLDELGPERIRGGQTRTARLTLAELHLRELDSDGAQEVLEGISITALAPEPGYLSRLLCIQAYLSLRAAAPDVAERIDEAFRTAERQGARVWASYARLLAGIQSASIGPTVVGLPERARSVISMLAEPIAEQMQGLDSEAARVVMAEVTRRPDRWRPAIRALVKTPGSKSRTEAARILDVIGERTDVAMLRALARESRRGTVDPDLGKGLARRLAERVHIEDLGRLVIRVGTAEVAGTSVRRKVLALLCLLLSRPGFAATRDEVIDALWPDIDPGAGINSLNQTVYFLRRVFEPEYSEDLSPGYVHHESELIWIDRELVSAQSQRCADLIAQILETSSMEALDVLSESYTGRFALDFMYEEWGNEYRDALHMGYLQVIESAVIADIEAGRYARGIALARRALVVEPKLESLERSLLRLFRLTGAHSAAAEQYQHYATMLREDAGIEAPPLESL